MKLARRRETLQREQLPRKKFLGEIIGKRNKIARLCNASHAFKARLSPAVAFRPRHASHGEKICVSELDGLHLIQAVFSP